MSPVGWSVSSVLPTWLVNSLLILLLYCLDWADSAACDSKPCGKEGACRENGNGGYRCICYIGQYGANCQKRCSERTLNSTNTGWYPWSDYTPCSRTCGSGFKRRTRTCRSPPGCAYECNGQRRESATCFVETCCDTVTLTWSSWTLYGECSKSCGEGSKKRTRECRGPSHCTDHCPGRSNQTRLCNTQICCKNELHGWGPWSHRTSCSRTCGGGVKTRRRNCKGRGTDCSYMCSGLTYESQPCNTEPCCVQSTDGWEIWAAFGSCSKNCGPGTNQRSRVCRGDNNTCQLCLGSYISTQECTVKARKDGAWSAWTSGSCSATCGTGHRTKTRTCNNPAPNECGNPCVGDPIAYESCPGLPPCCETVTNERVGISVSDHEVTIESDPDATGVGVIITCQAITCPGDTVQSIELKKIQVLATVDQRANGVAVDRAHLPNTDISGSLTESSLIYVFSKIRCQDIGVYHCTAAVHLSGGGSKRDKKSDSVEVKVKPGRFKVTPVGDTSDLVVNEVLQLNCSGSVGTVNSSTKVKIVWEYKNEADSEWTKISNPDIVKTQDAVKFRCDKMVMWTILKRRLTAKDDDRTYRCYLVKDGVPHNDTISDDLGNTVLINSADRTVSRAVLSLDPQQVTITRAGKLEVYISCTGHRSQNELVNLILAMRPTGQSATEQPRELAVANLPTSVENKVRGKNVVIRGGLLPRSISYDLKEASCHDAGTYICTAITKLPTKTRTTNQAKTLDLHILYHRANIYGDPSKSGATFKCTTLLRYGADVTQLAWHWERARADPRIVPDVKWRRVLPKRGVTIKNKVSTPSHKCYVVSTSTLHFPSNASNPYSKFYRCYISDGDTSFQNYSTVGKFYPPSSSALLSNTTLTIAAVVASVLLILLIVMIIALHKRRKSMKRRNKDVIIAMQHTPRSSLRTPRSSFHTPRSSFTSGGGRSSVYSVSQTPTGNLSGYTVASDDLSQASHTSYYLSGTTGTSGRSPTTSVYSDYN